MTSPASKSRFHWDDPFLLDAQLTDDERMVREAASAYCQEQLAPRALEAFRNHTTDPAITADQQFLLSEATIRAVEQLSATALRDRLVYVDTTYLTGPENNFLVAELRARLLVSGVRLTPNLGSAKVILEVRSGGIGIDRQYYMVGLPSFALPGTTWGFHLLEERSGTMPNEVITVKVREVYPGTAADKAGLERFDVVLKINGEKVTTNYDCIQAVGKVKGDSFTITVRTAAGAEATRELKR